MYINLKFNKSLPAALLLLSIASCGREKQSLSHEAAGQLFEKSLTLISAYTDSLSCARDSAHVETVIRSFESKLNAVNFEFPPDTDLRLTQEENDSLIKMTDRLVAARRNRLESFGKPQTDSIADNLAQDSAIIASKPPFHNQHN